MCLTSPWETESDDGMIYNIAEFVAVDNYNPPVSKTNMYLYAGSVYSKKIIMMMHIMMLLNIKGMEIYVQF